MYVVHEENITRQIRNNPNRKKLWEHIDKLRKKTKKTEERLKIYNEEGLEIPNSEMEEAIRTYWGKIYKMNENKIKQVWNAETKNECLRSQEITTFRNGDMRIVVAEEEDTEETVITCQEGTVEHLELAFNLKRLIQDMKYPEITEEMVKESIRKLEKKKAVGPDGMKGEFYKALQDSNIFMKLITKSFQKVIEEGKVPTSWKESRTTMIP